MTPTPPLPAPRTRPPRRRPAWAHGLVRRLAVGAVLGVTGFLLWTSVSRLVRARTQSREVTRRIAQLSGEIDVMRAQWPGSRTQAIADRLPAAQASLFSGPPAVAEWIESVRARAIPLDLETEFEFAGARTQAFDRNVAVLRTRLRVVPDHDATPSKPTYHRLLALGDHLARQPRRLDVLELSVRGDSNSVTEASAVIEMWSDDGSPATP
ncbi:MAG: hypothetical protein AB7O66_23530 [Limisphaerales bacterium]